VKTLRALLAGGWVLIGGWNACAADTPQSAPAAKAVRSFADLNLPNLDKKISLDLIEPMDVVDLIKFLAVKGDLNVIIGREVAGATKLMLKDVALGDAIDIVLAANGLAYEVKGNIIKVMTDKEYREMYGQGFYEQKQAKIIELKYARPSKVAQMLEGLRSTIGKIVVDDETGTLVLIDTPEKIKEMELVVQTAEIPSVARIMPTVTTNFVLQYAKVEDLEPQLLPLLTKDFGQLRSDKRTKTLMVTDLPHNLPRIAETIGLFDRETKQVFIEAKIVQVRLNDAYRLGVNWEYLFQSIDPRQALGAVSSFPLGLASAANDGAGIVPSYGKLTYHTIAAGSDLNVVMEALQVMGDTKVLSNPHIATLDGQEATIKVVEDQPYAELTYEVGTTNITGKSYKFIEVGVTLAVTPRINEAGFVTVDIKPEISTVIGTYDTEGGQGVPIVKKSVAETSVSVKDGVTIIIAGMINEIKQTKMAGLPVLCKIPVLGALFRWKQEETDDTETIVFLTPRIVTGDQPFLRSKDLKKSPRGAAVNAAKTAPAVVADTP
jgi:type II secretory pathway component GspD/PulD (secretin)